MAELRILGCSGGIGDGQHTTCFLLDGNTLVDVGTGLCSLSLRELRSIRHVLLTHSHLDHVLGLPLLLDSVSLSREMPLTIYGLPETLQALKAHFFNGVLWPTLSEQGLDDETKLIFREIRVGEAILNGRVSVLPAIHAIPACGYSLKGECGTLVFSGDTRGGMPFWQAVNQFKDLQYLIIETSYMNEDSLLAEQAHHLTANDLAREAKNLKLSPKIFITHLKPGVERGIMAQIGQILGARHEISSLVQGSKITF